MSWKSTSPADVPGTSPAAGSGLTRLCRRRCSTSSSVADGSRTSAPVSRGPSNTMRFKQQLLPTVLLLLLAFLALYPLMLLLLYSFQISSPGVDPVWSLQGWRDAFASPGIRQALWNTITIAVVTQAIAIVAGVALAWLIARTDIPGRYWLETGSWLAFFLPTLPVLLGWVLLLDPRFGVLN